MDSLADQLPPHIARQIHPEWRKNEAEYWGVRDSLMPQYADQWIAFSNGTVIAAGASPVDVLHEGQATGEHPYVTCVGREHEPTRMRRVAFAYDSAYRGEPLPRMQVEFRTASGSAGVLLDQVIPDTGADASALPWADCLQLKLDPSQGVPGLITGVGQSTAATVVFAAWVYLDGTSHRCRLQADLSGDERLLGRDVLNRVDVLFRGPHGEVVVNP